MLALLLAVAVHAIILGIHLGLSETNRRAVYSLSVNLLKQERGEPTASASVSIAPSKLAPSHSAPPPTVTRAALTDLVATLAPTEKQTPPPEQLIQGALRSATEPSKPNTPRALMRTNAELALLAPTPLAATLNNGLQVIRAHESVRTNVDYAREKRINRESMTTLEEYYVQAWERKIEKVATLNFPKEALQRRLSGSLILDVALKGDGSVHSITLIKSSGYPLLDNAAKAIVELAGPYAPFPEDLRRKYDILHISRIWNFLQGDLLD